MDDATAATDRPGREPLPAEELRQWAAAHHPWAVGTGSDRLLRTFTFDSFGDAMRFMAAIAPEIERLDHHPEWQNVVNQVWVELTTHDAGGVTARDLALADAMDSAAAGIAGSG
jgi:4a-hydroxytetrahydrobiopterin dehydratase